MSARFTVNGEPVPPSPKTLRVAVIAQAPPSPVPTSQTKFQARIHHSRTCSINSREYARHGRMIRLEQKATKVLGIIFFTFVILWAPFFVLNLVLAIFPEWGEDMNPVIFDFATWLGYSSSMVNPIFYTIFNKVFRDAFKKVLTCRKEPWRPPQTCTRLQDWQHTRSGTTSLTERMARI